MNARALVLGGYGAVGQHTSRVLSEAGLDVLVGGRRREPAERLAGALSTAEPLLVDVAAPDAVRAAAGSVDVVVNCSGSESVELVDAVLQGGAHLVDISASYQFQSAVTDRVSPSSADLEVLFSVGVTPGLTNLLAADHGLGHSKEPLELVVILGVGEDHGRAARDWMYGLLGQDFADTTGQRGSVRNFTHGAKRVIPGVGTFRVYRVDFSDQHVLTGDLDHPVVTRHGLDWQTGTMLVAWLSRLPGAPRLLRALESVVPWSWLGTDQWVVAAGQGGDITRWIAGRNQSRATGIVAALAAQSLLEGPPRGGVTHLHQRASLHDFADDLKRHGIEVA